MNDLEAERTRDLFLQFFDLVGVELHHITRIHINDMVMMRTAGLLEARRPARKGMAMDRAAFLKKFHGAINR